MSIKKDTMPQFETEEQEAEYWDTHSPLDLIAEPKAQKVRVRGAKDKPITIRLDSETRLKLNKLAAKHGLGPSTFARLILASTIEHQSKLPKTITLDALKDILEQNLPRSVKDKAEALVKATAIGDSNNPTLLIIDASQMKESEELVWSLFTALLSMVGVQVVTPEDKRYEEVKHIVKAQHRKEVTTA